MLSVTQYLSDNAGETAIEYGMIACLISVLVLGAATMIGGSVADSLNAIVSAFLP